MRILRESETYPAGRGDRRRGMFFFLEIRRARTLFESINAVVCACREPAREKETLAVPRETRAKRNRMLAFEDEKRALGNKFPNNVVFKSEKNTGPSACVSGSCAASEAPLLDDARFQRPTKSRRDKSRADERRRFARVWFLTTHYSRVSLESLASFHALPIWSPMDTRVLRRKRAT